MTFLNIFILAVIQGLAELLPRVLMSLKENTMSHYPTIGWYGKLPSAGDFLQRRFPDVIRNSWENWFQVGLHNWQRATERQEVSRPFGEAPVWNFVVPPMLGSQVVQMGCLLPRKNVQMDIGT